MATVDLGGKMPMPIVGLGTGFEARPQPGQVAPIVIDALKIGYRHFDCARAYLTEADVGAGLAEGGVAREEIFITSKLFGSFMSPDRVKICLDQSLTDLRTNYVNLYLLHSPCSINEGRKRDSLGLFIPGDDDYLTTWTEMESLRRREFVDSIGVCNFNREQMERMLDNAEVKPVVNQIESHPYFNNQELITYCKNNGVHVSAFSPFGRPDFHRDFPPPLQDPVVVTMATKKATTPGKILLRFALQRGLSVLPRSSDYQHQADNFSCAKTPSATDILSEAELADLMRLNRPDGRVISLEEFIRCSEYPFSDGDFRH